MKPDVIIMLRLHALSMHDGIIKQWMPRWLLWFKDVINTTILSWYWCYDCKDFYYGWKTPL